MYRVWWRCLMDLRPVVRYSAERFPRLAPSAVRLRSLLHLLAGNPIQVVAAIYVVAFVRLGLRFRWAFVLWLAVWMLVELGHQVALSRAGRAEVLWLVGWREAWRVRRRWPADWASAAAKTARVQAEVGTSKEPIASARLRPVADHPKLSWFPRIEWPVVSWWAGPPPGRSFTALDEMTTVLAANISHCIDVEIDYERPTDSWGRLVVTFDDPLDRGHDRSWQPAPVEDGGAVVIQLPVAALEPGEGVDDVVSS